MCLHEEWRIVFVILGYIVKSAQFSFWSILGDFLHL